MACTSQKPKLRAPVSMQHVLSVFRHAEGCKDVHDIAGSASFDSLPVELHASKVQKPFGNAPLMAEIEEGNGMLGLHVTLGGFPMKAWMKKEGADTLLLFSNSGRWQKL